MEETLKNEIATIQKDPAKFIFGGVLTNEDDILLSRGGGKGLKIYDEIERDCHAFAVIQKRKNAVIAREWQVIPASESAPDKKAADLVREQLKSLKFDQVCLKLLDAVLKGFSVGEIIWETDGKEIVASRVKAKSQRRFVFDELMNLRLLTRTDPILGETLPERKFVIHRCGEKDDDNPYGLGLGHKLFWPVFFKRQDITFWLTFVDKFASPTAVGEYPQGTSKNDQKKLLDALAAISNESQVIIPEGMLVEFLEAARSGSIDTYEKLARYMDEQISVCVLGETMSTTVKAAGLGSGQAEVQNEVRTELARGDSDLLSDTINETLVRWIVDFNLPNAKPPKIWRDFSEPEDMKARAETDKAIYDMGFEPDEAYINETYGGKWRKRETINPTLTPALSPGSSPGQALKERGNAAEFAEGGGFTPDQQAIEGLADKSLELGIRSLELNEQKILDAVQGSGSFEEALQRLLELYPGMDMKGIEDVMERAILNADLFGRHIVANP